MNVDIVDGGDDDDGDDDETDEVKDTFDVIKLVDDSEHKIRFAATAAASPVCGDKCGIRTTCKREVSFCIHTTHNTQRQTET